MDKQAEDADETEETANIPEQLIGTWTDEAGTETYRRSRTLHRITQEDDYFLCNWNSS